MWMLAAVSVRAQAVDVYLKPTAPVGPNGRRRKQLKSTEIAVRRVFVCGDKNVTSFEILLSTYIYIYIYIYIFTYMLLRIKVLLRIKEQRNILHEVSKWKANWIGHILRRNCLLQQVIEGKIKGWIEVKGRRGRRRRMLLYDLKESRGYTHLKEEALDHSMWRSRFGRSFGPVSRHY
jgi:hypothetical protein